VNFQNQLFKNILQYHIHRHFTSKSAAQNRVKINIRILTQSTKMIWWPGSTKTRYVCSALPKP